MRNGDEMRIHLPHPSFDSHFHALEMINRGVDAATAVAAARQAGLVGALDAAVDEANFDRRSTFAGQVGGILLSVGIHPSSTAVERGIWRDRFDIVWNQIACPGVVAVGETGLDFYRDHSPHEIQEKAFRDHLDLAAETGRPVIVHNRNADDRVLALIRESRCRHGVFHCFSSDWETARRALDLGFYVSFAGNITYAKTEVLRNAAARIPEDRLLAETDAPFLSPAPVRGRANHPGHIGYTLEALADIRKTDPFVIAECTVENARNLFGPPSGRGSPSAGPVIPAVRDFRAGLF